MTGSSGIAALKAALTAENAACYGYGIVGAHLSGAARKRARADWIAHQVARDRLEAMLRSADVPPAPAAAAYALPLAVSTASEARMLAALLERRVARAYVGLVAVTDVRLRRHAARELRDCALRQTSWSGTTQAFPGLAGG